eukprot:TRINITY_DN12290_c0_g1_i1.p1 TRINITY_DN12290_c0_g1~~TRINITY_DN12290_c0_g1_i1.p1  ORF type:complete len:675 (+),score=150.46 TRINITY_DN12290_c0_g1_i1:245-2269(+)
MAERYPRRKSRPRTSRRLNVARDNEDKDDQAVTLADPSHATPGDAPAVLSTPSTTQSSAPPTQQASLQAQRRQAKRSRRELLLGRAQEATRAATTFVAQKRTDADNSDTDDDGAAAGPVVTESITSFTQVKQVPIDLRLPPALALLAQMAEQLDVLVCFGGDRAIPTFDRLQGQLRRVLHRNFSLRHLGQIAAVMPEYYRFKQILRKDVQSGTGSYALKIGMAMPGRDNAPLATAGLEQVPSTLDDKPDSRNPATSLASLQSPPVSIAATVSTLSQPVTSSSSSRLAPSKQDPGLASTLPPSSSTFSSSSIESPLHAPQSNASTATTTTATTANTSAKGGSPPPQTPKLDIERDVKLTVGDVQERAKIMRGRLLDHVFTAHAEHLRRLPGQPSVAIADIQRWHSGFRLSDVPDIEPAPLPQPPTRQYHTAADILSRVAQSGRAHRPTARIAKPPPVEVDVQRQYDTPAKTGAGIQTPALPEIEGTATSTSDDGSKTQVSAPIYRALQKAAELEQPSTEAIPDQPKPKVGDDNDNEPKATVEPSKALLDGLVSSDMLHRIRQRDKAKTELNLRITSDVTVQRQRLDKLLKVVSVVWSETSKRRSLPFDRLAGSVAKSCRDSITLAAEMLEFAHQTCPTWCSILTIDGKKYFKVNRDVKLSETKRIIEEAKNNLEQ